ncbi:ARM repeat-containing protein [Violaceomyces palustris]|uniref:ARM repeat-containing protein n=1 Tax=Violaceomyces palustris TaxID=1673888 RepID=A0ACD0P5C5_9BASI|nr:ARM repeat-containing protein [Violaceomyces palustris]
MFMPSQVRGIAPQTPRESTQDQLQMGRGAWPAVMPRDLQEESLLPLRPDSSPGPRASLQDLAPPQAGYFPNASAHQANPWTPTTEHERTAFQGARRAGTPSSMLDFPQEAPFTCQHDIFSGPGKSAHKFAPKRSPLPTPPHNFRTASSSSLATLSDPELRKSFPVDVYASPEVLVQKTLHSRSQESSIVLQQQLKSSPAERKRNIIKAIEPHLLSLSKDRHGNFLVQRACKHAYRPPRLAWLLKGHFVELSLSQFGCHVVQRVLDEDERLKVMVVEEMLTSRLVETLTSRNSIHVWQKILEINWTHSGFRSAIFTTINKMMKGRWAQAAMQETGSIICQNIFESADMEEKKDCLEEVLEKLPECAANQWGVWVVQHIIEHGNELDREAALTRLLDNVVPLTLSQYGQKAVMSALKSGNQDFLENYVNLLCEKESLPAATSSNRRSVLVDVALSPHGIQIVTQLLTSISSAQREKVISTVRKNSVFLKGSKAGLKVHQLCERARAFTGY